MSYAHGVSNDGEPRALTPSSVNTTTKSSPSSTPSTPSTSRGDDHDPMHSEEHIGSAAEKRSASKAPSSENLVDFDGPEDPYKPTNWPLAKKVITTLLYGLTTAGSTWASSVYAPATAQIAEEFGVSETVSILGLTLFLFGFGLGPLLWAPLSEAYGRRVAVFPPYFIAGCFCFGTAAAKDIQTVLITRFFTGFFGSAPITNTGGVLGDIWLAEQRGIAILGYSLALAGGPLFSPIAGAAIVQSYLEWRWTFYLTGIMLMAILFFDVILLDESSAPVLLANKASRLRRETGNWALHAKHEELGASLNRLFTKFMVRPWQLLATPICFFMVLYASFVYGLVYLNFAAFPIEYESVRRWSPVLATLPYIPIFIGCLLAGVFSLYNQRFYLARFHANNNRPVPEARLRPMMLGSIVYVIGIFIFAWTSDPRIHWIGSCIGAALMGFGFFSIFQGTTTYLVDTFQAYAASALAAVTLVRSVFAGVFPLFTNQMFDQLGVDWAVSLLGFVALAMVPIPFFFSFYGKRIRARGKWSKGSTL